jgi:hypothetical protein
VEHFLSTQLGELFKEALDEEGDLTKIEAFGTIFEFDPFKDLYSVTAYGCSFEKEEGVALFKGRFENEKIIALMGIEGAHTEFDHGGCVVHEWKEGRDHFFVAFPRKSMVVISNSRELIQEALDVLEGDRDSLDDRGEMRGFRSAPRGTFLAAAAHGLEHILGCDGEPEAAVLKMAKDVTVFVGEVEGDDFLDVTLSTQDSKSAKQVHDILAGLIALGSLFGEEEPELAWLMKSLEFEQDGRTVRIRVALPAMELSGKLKVSMECE